MNFLAVLAKIVRAVVVADKLITLLSFFFVNSHIADLKKQRATLISRDRWRVCNGGKIVLKAFYNHSALRITSQ